MRACRSGGLYISPGISGSRPGALIATAWAAMVGLGMEGYLTTTRGIMDATARFVAGVEAMPDLKVRRAGRMLHIYATRNIGPGTATPRSLRAKRPAACAS